MARQASTPGGQAQVKWNRSMKVAVYVIHAEYNLPKKERAAIFNQLFARELAACGLPDGTSAEKIGAQWGERGKTNPDWVAIYQSRRGAADAAEKDSMRQRVRQVLQGIRGDRTPDGNIGDNATVTTRFTPARPVATPTTPRQRGNSTNTRAVSSESKTTHTPTTDVFMSMTLEDHASSVRTGGTRPSTAFREALTRAAYTHPNTPPPLNKPLTSAMHPPKRSLEEASDSDDYSPGPKRTMTRKQKGVVMVPSAPLAGGSPRAAASTQSPAGKSPRVPTLLNNGKTVMLTPRQAEKRTTRSEPVDKYRAHPPMKGLLFRVWEEDPACDRDSRQGHCARKYWRKNAVPNDPPSVLDPTDVLNHMDREMVDSPFISTCSRLVWTVQLMLKYLKAGKSTCRVSVINAAALDKRAIFHARPYHDDLVKMAAFTNGAWRYHGTNEYLIFKQIPAEAIVHVFRAQDLVNVATDVEAIGRALQFEILRVSNKNLTRTKIPLMKKNNVVLSQDITGGIAELCTFLGLDAHSPVDHLSHIVSDVVEGWALSVEHREEDEWYALATMFASRLCKPDPQPVTVTEREAAKFAFLNGVAWGRGDANAALKPELVAAKQRKASRVGLASPARICARALDAAKLSILALEKAQEMRLDRYHQQRLRHDTTADSGVDVTDDGFVDVEVDMDGFSDGGSVEDDVAADDSDDDIVFTDRQLGL